MFSRNNIMRQLLERQDLTDDQKIKLYHQTLQRYIELNKQRTAPLTMTLQTEMTKYMKTNPLECELQPRLKREKVFKTPDKLNVPQGCPTQMHGVIPRQ